MEKQRQQGRRADGHLDVLYEHNRLISETWATERASAPAARPPGEAGYARGCVPCRTGHVVAPTFRAVAARWRESRVEISDNMRLQHRSATHAITVCRSGDRPVDRITAATSLSPCGLGACMQASLTPTACAGVTEHHPRATPGRLRRLGLQVSAAGATIRKPSTLLAAHETTRG